MRGATARLSRCRPRPSATTSARPAATSTAARGCCTPEPGSTPGRCRWRPAPAAGRGTLRVARRPRVSFLSTGEEIIEPGAAPGPYQIFDSGTIALVALARDWGAAATRLKPVGDSIAATVEAVRSEPCDLIVT